MAQLTIGSNYMWDPPLSASCGLIGNVGFTEVLEFEEGFCVKQTGNDYIFQGMPKGNPNKYFFLVTASHSNRAKIVPP